VAALLGAWLLVFEVDAGSAALDEHLGQLHDRRQPTVPRVSIYDSVNIQ
jgi:hypothetical protein